LRKVLGPDHFTSLRKPEMINTARNGISI